MPPGLSSCLSHSLRIQGTAQISLVDPLRKRIIRHAKPSAPTSISPSIAFVPKTLRYGVCEGLEVDLPFTTEDVPALGITLFLECSRKGILPQETEGLPF